MFIRAFADDLMLAVTADTVAKAEAVLSQRLVTIRGRAEKYRMRWGLGTCVVTVLSRSSGVIERASVWFAGHELTYSEHP